MYDPPRIVRSARDARDTLRAARDVVDESSSFAAQVCQLALQCETIDQLARIVESLYRIGLDLQDPFLPDLADAVLCWIELVQRDEAVEALPIGGFAALG